MNNDKNFWQERPGNYIVWGILIVVTFFFAWFGYLHNPGESTDKFVTENLWEALHPMNVFNVLGQIFWFAFLFGLSGLWKKWIGTILLPAGSAWPQNVGFVLGVFAVILIWI